MDQRGRFSVSKWLCALTLAGFCAACGGSETGRPATGGTTEEGTSTSAAAEKEKKPDLPVYREVTIPAGTTLRLDLQSAVASDTSQVEDTVRASLRQAVTVDGQAVLPMGAELVGTVTDVERSGRVKGLARVAYRFSSLRHDSERYPITTARSRIRHRRRRGRMRRRSVWAQVSVQPWVRFSVEAVAQRRARRLAARPEPVWCLRHAAKKFGSDLAPTSARG